MGLLWGHWGASFEGVTWCEVFNALRMLKIGLFNLYSKVMAIGAIVSKLDSGSLGKNTARPAGGR